MEPVKVNDQTHVEILKFFKKKQEAENGIRLIMKVLGVKEDAIYNMELKQWEAPTGDK